MYPNLKVEIFKRGIHQNRLAKALGINEVVLSKIIHGHREPSESQKKVLAGFLAVDEAWLFEKYECAAELGLRNLPDPRQEPKNGEPQS